MKAYELLFFVAPTLDEETRAAAMKRIETAITDGNGVIDQYDYVLIARVYFGTYTFPAKP